MSNKNIDRAAKNHEDISKKIESITLNSIRKVLPDKAIEDACNASGYQYRQRVITPIITVLHIETLFRELKINLSADVLRSMSPNGIRKEIAARLIAVNIVRMIMLEAAIEKGVDPIRISFVHAVRAILMFAPALAREPIWKLPEIYKAMLVEIGTNLVPERRGRNEPRAVIRERKHYPHLRTTREQWRIAYAA